MTDVQFEKLLEKQEARLVKHLGQEMDRRFAEQDARLDKRFEAIDQRFAEQDERWDKRLQDALERNNTVLFGQLTRYFDTRLKEELDPMRAQINELYVMLDGLIKRMKDEEAERAAEGYAHHRYEGYFRQLAKSTKTTLSPKLELQPDD